MGADSVLVNAAFKEATSRASGDVLNMKPMYDSNVSNINKVFNTISGAMGVYSAKKELGRAGVRKQLEGFQAQANAGVKDMYGQDEPMHDAFINAFRDKIMGLQDEFEDVNTFGKGDTQENSQARTRIEGELKRVISQANKFRGQTEIFFDNLENVDPGNVHGPSVAAHQQALNFKDYDRLLDEGKIEVNYGKDGIEITSRNYDTQVSGGFGTSSSFARNEKSVGEDVTVTLASLNENFRPTNIEHHTKILTDVNDYTKSGALQGKQAEAAFNANGEMVEFNWNEEEAISNFTRQVDSRDNFRNVVSSKVKGLYEIETSFKASLEKNINISVDLLQNMFVDDNGDGINDLEEVFKQLDVAGGKDGDGVINEKDLAASGSIPGFERNLDAMIDALTNTSNPAFNMKTSAPMLGAFLAEAAKGRSELAFSEAAGSRRNKEKAQLKKKQVPLSVQQSRQKAAAINKVVGSKINEQGIKSLELELGARVVYKTLPDGRIRIMDSADNEYFIDPNDPVDARSTLYGLAKINQEDRNDQLMGIAKVPDDPKTGKTENDYFNMITE